MRGSSSCPAAITSVATTCRWPNSSSGRACKPNRRMKTALKWLAGLTGAVIVLALFLAVQSWYFRPPLISIFFERAFLQFMLEDPEAVSSLGIFEQLGYKGFDGMLTDVSPEHERKLARM